MISGPSVNVEKVLLAVKIRKPRKDEFIRVHPDPEFVRDYVVLELEDGMDRALYLVLPSVRHLVPIELTDTRLHIAINQATPPEVFVWPIKLPQDISRGSKSWSESALKCAEESKHLSVRVVANKSAGYYDLYRLKAI